MAATWDEVRKKADAAKAKKRKGGKQAPPSTAPPIVTPALPIGHIQPIYSDEYDGPTPYAIESGIKVHIGWDAKGQSIEVPATDPVAIARWRATSNYLKRRQQSAQQALERVQK